MTLEAILDEVYELHNVSCGTLPAGSTPKGATMGLDLLGGTRVEQARKLAEMLNEHVLEVFLTSDQ